jgi:hypothetical protein
MKDMKNDGGTLENHNNKVQSEKTMNDGDTSNTTVEQNKEDPIRVPTENPEINGIDYDPDCLHGEWIRVERKKNGKKINRSGFGGAVKGENVLSQLIKDGAINGEINVQNQLQKTIEAFNEGLRQKSMPKLKKKRPRMDFLAAKQNGPGSSRGPNAITRGNSVTKGGGQPKIIKQGDGALFKKEVQSNVVPSKGKEQQLASTMPTQQHEGHIKKDGNPTKHNKPPDPNLMGKDHMQIEEINKNVDSEVVKSMARTKEKNIMGLTHDIQMGMN